MFCEKCGSKVLEKDKFCGKCGTQLQEVDNIEKKETMSKQLRDFESKSWYRLLKVIYIVAFFIGVIFVVGISFSSIPKRNLDDNLSTIKCDNGKIYSLSKNDLYASASFLDSSEDKNARILCQYDTVNYYGSFYSNQNIAFNYTFNPVYTQPDYSGWFLGSAAFLLITWLLLKFIKIGTLYITTGEKPCWKKELKKIF